ncbi:MAG: chorismate mutase [Prolixibacteraceae bacterium]|nr:chorismate mutase [Prolixibacteraceae bacterium]
MKKDGKKACECKSIEEIRAQIDVIDRELVRLFAKRFEYVKEVVKYKDKTEDAVVAIERKEFVIGQRADWAKELGLDPEMFAKLFEQLIDHNISKEMELIKETTK